MQVVQVMLSADGRWRIETTPEAITVYEVMARGSLLLRYACRSPADLDAWLREHAGTGLADLRDA